MGDRLKDKVALVIGGSSGISRGVALRFAEEGAAVTVADLIEEPREGGDPTAERITGAGGEGAFVACDLTDADSTAAAFADIERRHGRLDVLFIGAGMAEPTGDTREIDIAAFDRHMALNVRGTFLAIQHALRTMIPRRYGRIVPVASNFGQVGVAGMTAYCGAKAAVIGMTRAVAVEVGPHNVTINALCPGATKTAINKGYREDEHIQSLWRQETPLRMEDGEYIAEVHDIAAAALYLASDDARFMTGACLTIDGGWIAH